MGDGLEGVRSAPRFDKAVRRSSVDQAVRTGVADLFLLVAPSGYGKSVAAAQIAREDYHDACVWVDCSLLDPVEPHALLHETLLAFGVAYSAHGGSANPLMPECSAREDNGAIEHALKAYRGSRLCVVLDSLPEALPLHSVLSVTSSLHCDSECTVTVIGTTRGYDTLDSSLARLSVLGIEFLRMSPEESRRLLESIAGESLDEATIQGIIEVSDGQAALICLLGRHAAAGSIEVVLSGKRTVDLDALLYASANTQLTPADRGVLFAASLLSQGSIADLEAILGDGQLASLRRVAERVPLVHAETDGAARRFCVHDLAGAAFCRAEWASSCVPDWESILGSALTRLDATNRHDRLFETALAVRVEVSVMTEWVVRCGHALLDSGHLSLLSATLDAVGPLMSIQRPEVLLLQARVLREQQCYEQALRKSQVAYRLAAHEGSAPLAHESLLVTARLQLDLGLIGDAARSLEKHLSTVPLGTSPESIVLARAYLAACTSYVGDYVVSEAHMRAATAALSPVVSAEIRARVAICSAATDGLVRGRWNVVLEQFQSLADDADLSLSARLQVRGNLGTVLCEMGRIERASELLSHTLSECREHGFKMLERAFLGSLAAAEAAIGNYGVATELVESALSGHEDARDVLEFGHTLAYQSSWLRAQGQVGQSLLKAERILEASAASECEWLRWIGLLEVAAGHLASGDIHSARRQASAVLGLAIDADAQFHCLCAELLLAETDRRRGDLRTAASRVSQYRDYIMTGSANWQLCMYLRAFPGLLGPIAMAIEPFELPVQLFRSLMAVEPERLLEACARDLPDSTWKALRTRLLGDDPSMPRTSRSQHPMCQVELFGGAGVQVGERRISERAWKKSKARLLFLMLVLANGKETPREQILDYLWPEMDEVRARNNFYVVWSAMKLALTPGAEKGSPCVYTDNSRGVCKLDTELVQSDIARFEELVARLNSTTSSVEKLSLCEELAGTYRGELLPGDVYEDWFSSARDKYRVQFADAMLLASGLLHQRGEIPRALMMARRGLEEDPLREDLGQAALQLQIASGQRSAAIETFMSIKRRLCDDLGIDPSAETVRLYERVLAMEEMGEYLADEESAGEPESAV